MVALGDGLAQRATAENVVDRFDLVDVNANSAAILLSQLLLIDVINGLYGEAASLWHHRAVTRPYLQADTRHVGLRQQEELAFIKSEHERAVFGA